MDPIDKEYIIYKHIIVAVDESDVSSRALKDAISLCKVHNAKLRIIHVIDEIYSGYLIAGFDYEQLKHSFKIEAQKLLDKMETYARKSIDNCDSQLIKLELGERVSDKIIEAGKKLPADLIVIGTHGRRGFQHFLLGSVAEGVIRSAEVPVLLIRCKKINSNDKLG